MNGELLPARGEIWWARLDKRRPVLVVQTNAVREQRTRTFLVVPLTSRLNLGKLAGNVRLSRRESGLPKASVANIYDIQKVIATEFMFPVRSVSQSKISEVENGLRLLLGL